MKTGVVHGVKGDPAEINFDQDENEIAEKDELIDSNEEMLARKEKEIADSMNEAMEIDLN